VSGGRVCGGDLLRRSARRSSLRPVFISSRHPAPFSLVPPARGEGCGRVRVSRLRVGGGLLWGQVWGWRAHWGEGTGRVGWCVVWVWV
jgi:hypothetical protein